MASKAFFLLSTIWIKTWKLLENFYEDILENAPPSVSVSFHSLSRSYRFNYFYWIWETETESNYQRHRSIRNEETDFLAPLYIIECLHEQSDNLLWHSLIFTSSLWMSGFEIKDWGRENLESGRYSLDVVYPHDQCSLSQLGQAASNRRFYGRRKHWRGFYLIRENGFVVVFTNTTFQK